MLQNEKEALFNSKEEENLSAQDFLEIVDYLNIDRTKEANAKLINKVYNLGFIRGIEWNEELRNRRG